MTRTWMVGVDGSTGSRVALTWAVNQASGRDVRLHVVSAWSVPLAGGSVGVPGVIVDWEEVQHAVAARLDEVIASVGPTDVQIEPVVVQGGASWSLLETSKRAELLVVGSRGLGGFKRLVLGSVSRQCATHATVPTVVVPDHAPLRPAEQIVVGVDGSENSAAALGWALDFARPGAKIEAISAIDVSPWIDPATTLQRFPKEVEQAEREVAAVLDRIDPDHRATRSVLLHDPRQALAEASVGADLVVVGARGRGAVGAMLLGSVTTWLLHGARCATVVVPHAHE